MTPAKLRQSVCTCL